MKYKTVWTSVEHDVIGAFSNFWVISIYFRYVRSEMILKQISSLELKKGWNQELKKSRVGSLMLGLFQWLEVGSVIAG